MATQEARGILFEVISKFGKRIRLTRPQWIHILDHHKEMENQTEKLRETLQEPDFIAHNESEDTYRYYKFFPETPVSPKHVLVLTKHLNDEGFIITTFFLRKIKEKGRFVWTKS
ncbi:MAG: hypothetical protein H8D67_04350 [Deltaproteobacteria bacterium]|nr:hypothetical protein [Deltaproteobacteria bacterium]